MMGFGAFAGASMLHRAVIITRHRISAMVGTFGTAGERLSVVTATARNLL